MKIQLEIKSVLLGLALGAGIMFVVGAGTSPNDNENGRYQISAGASTAVIVDTRTGQAWGYLPVSTTQNRSDANFWDAKQP